MIPEDCGIIIPKTKDGRLLFISNYLGHPMVGTTDVKCDVTEFCQPTEEEIQFMFNELEPYFGKDYDFKNNLLSSWAGIRPLVKEQKEKSIDQINKEKKEWENKSLWEKTKSQIGNGIRGLAKVIHYKK